MAWHASGSMSKAVNGGARPGHSGRDGQTSEPEAMSITSRAQAVSG